MDRETQCLNLAIIIGRMVYSSNSSSWEQAHQPWSMLGPGHTNFHRSHYRMFLCLEAPKPTPLLACSNTSALLRALREALAALTAPTDLGGIGHRNAQEL